jgi:putative peptidoglycan lipid II flippase
MESDAGTRPPGRGAVVRAAGVVAAATLASRILGFVRDLVVARAFGAGLVTDAFFVAFRLPNLFRRLFAEGAVSSAFVPVFTEYLTTRGRTETVRMYRAVSGAMVGVLALVTLAGMVLAPLLVRLMAPGFFADPTLGGLTVHLSRLMFPYLLLMGLGALAMGMLNAQRHFLVPALSPVALNLAIIAAVFLLVPYVAPPVLGLAVGVLVGGMGQWAIQLPALARRGMLVRPTLEPRHPAVRRVARLMAPVVLGQSASHLNTLVNTVVASFLGGGRVSYLYYADRLMEFPLGVFGVAIATAVLPTLSEHAAARRESAVRETLSFALRLAAFISAPAAAGLLVLREPLVRILYQRGEFGAAETAGTATALGFYAVGLVGLVSAKVGVQAFFALGDTRTPVRVAVGTMVLNSVLAVGLAFPLGHGGLALATSCSATVNAAALAWLLRQRLGVPVGPAAVAARLGWLRIAGVSVALAAALAGAVRLWPPPGDPLTAAGWLGLMVLGGVVGYGLVHAVLGSEEARLAWRVLRQRRRRDVLHGA